MKLTIIKYFILSIFLAGVVAGTRVSYGGESLSKNLASVFFTQSISAPDLQKKFDEALSTGKKIKILIVPGHEPDFGGAEFRDLKERDFVVDLGQELAEYLSENPHYDVFLTRGKELWNPEIQRYFNERRQDIISFISSQKTEMARLISEGKIEKIDDVVPHNSAPGDVAVRLYGINKWANENEMDIVLHIHFNDYPRAHFRQEGKYRGLSIYAPEKQYSNSQATKTVASKILARLNNFFATSNLPNEEGGVVEDQDLIAVGSGNTVDGVSMLIEYGYIYEPQFSSSATRKEIFKELAFQTYLGLEDFFGETLSIIKSQSTTLLPYEWSASFGKSEKANKETLSLQAALLFYGAYPPRGMTKNDCPLSGFFGECTRLALSVFQKKMNINGDGSTVGPQTRAKLNELY